MFGNCLPTQTFVELFVFALFSGSLKIVQSIFLWFVWFVVIYILCYSLTTSSFFLENFWRMWKELQPLLKVWFLDNIQSIKRCWFSMTFLDLVLFFVRLSFFSIRWCFCFSSVSYCFSGQRTTSSRRIGTCAIAVEVASIFLPLDFCNMLSQANS